MSRCILEKEQGFYQEGWDDFDTSRIKKRKKMEYDTFRKVKKTKRYGSYWN